MYAFTYIFYIHTTIYTHIFLEYLKNIEKNKEKILKV